jgi:hypothetical protein
MAAPQRRDSSVHCSSSSISRTELKEIKLQQHLHLNGDESGGPDGNPVLQKLQKWADYPSYGTSVSATKFLPMKVRLRPLHAITMTIQSSCSSMSLARPAVSHRQGG